jgi:hypothetical protein
MLPAKKDVKAALKEAGNTFYVFGREKGTTRWYRIIEVKQRNHITRCKTLHPIEDTGHYWFTPNAIEVR